MALAAKQETHVEIPAGGLDLPGDLTLPPGALGVVVFAHGSGSSRLSPRNRMVAERLHEEGPFGTLLFDLLTLEEDELYRNRFEIGLLTDRLVSASRWVVSESRAAGLPLGLFGASTGAAAAVIASVEVPEVRAVVSRGGRPDLAGDALRHVRVPTLLIVGGADEVVLELNRLALADLAGEAAIEVVPYSSHLFPEPGALEQVAHMSAEWFRRFLPQRVEPRRR